MARRNTYRLSEKHALPFKSGNKQKRQDLFIKQKQVREKAKREERFSRKKAEDQNPKLRAERLKNNEPLTIDRKRVWDDVDSGDDDILGLSIDIERLKRRKLEQEADQAAQSSEEASEDGEDADSMLDSDSELEEDEQQRASKTSFEQRQKEPSPPKSTASTNLDLMPEALANKFSSLFNQTPPPIPKILLTTTFNSTLHYEASLLTRLFPNCVYIPRSAHRYSHKYSVKEISKFAANRNYTAVIILREDQKRPCGLDIVHLPMGPMFHFSISNWVEGRKLPGHGKPTNHHPELILNNFRTPLGLLTAKLFQTMFPPQPEFQGRQVVTLHNQRDFIFVRRHRYVFRGKRETEKTLVGADGKELKGAEDIRAGLQELGPRFTLKLRRIDKGIQRSSGQEWEWKGKTDRIRTKFQL
ncbi:MAG: hypothetical protein GOMPHAMPRED_007621 [Gomphillus americanus]|uniref:Brix domain-containing protein n=1 Tax=Gomphillus americanus TaxID=1940652 RepID=A0A8H3IBI3_9LECA|nr:MAG: hypothetical protein GOMPHAMPRED_007621 [Gomphillus americanus]